MTQHVQHGVEQGCLVAAPATPGMVVTIGADTPSANSIINGNVSTSLSTTSVAIAAADSAQDRYDLISADSAGVVTATTGALGSIANGTAYQPDTTDVKLAYVPVVAGVTAINAVDVQDVRIHVLRQPSPYRVSGNWYSGVGNFTPKGFTTSLADVFIGMPFRTEKAFSINNLAINLTTSNANSSAVQRLGIYSDDGAGGISLGLDAGTISVSVSATTGVVTLGMSYTFTPGLYWVGGASQSHTSGSFTLTAFFGNSNQFFVAGSPVGQPTGSLTTAIGAISKSSVTGALPTTLTGLDYSRAICPLVWMQAV